MQLKPAPTLEGQGQSLFKWCIDELRQLLDLVGIGGKRGIAFDIDQVGHPELRETPLRPQSHRPETLARLQAKDWREPQLLPEVPTRHAIARRYELAKAHSDIRPACCAHTRVGQLFRKQRGRAQ